MEEVYLKPQWMQDDGIHPNRDAQPFIADWMAKQLTLFSPESFELHEGGT